MNIWESDYISIHLGTFALLRKSVSAVIKGFNGGDGLRSDPQTVKSKF